MTETILVAGTASHVGKSTVATGLCRLLADRGYEVAPFKAQNMSNNARAVLSGPAVETSSRDDLHSVNANGVAASKESVAADGIEPGVGDDTQARWGEIGVSQFVQAQAARSTPTTDSNPVLLKPRGDGESQLVIDGTAVAHLPADSYYEDHWEEARAAAIAAYHRLARSADVIVAEGAGSIAEINLHDRDLSNIETARFAEATILLCVDIERGGAFASLYGTLALLPDDVRERVAGAIITKFRGDASILEPGIRAIEARCGVPVLGVVPYAAVDLPEEDSLGIPDGTAAESRGANDGVPDAASVTIGVPRLPNLSNSADLESLAAVPGVRIAYVPLTDAGRERLASADAIVLPGTKNAVDDLADLRAAGFGSVVRSFEGPLLGICGGYQMLGHRLCGAHLEGTGTDSSIEGFGVLPVETQFLPTKRVRSRRVPVDGTGPIAGATGTATGYEIHAGESTILEPVEEPLEAGSAARGSVLGTYLHGLFENEQIRTAFVESVYRDAGIDCPTGNRVDSDTPTDPIDDVAALLDRTVDLSGVIGAFAGANG